MCSEVHIPFLYILEMVDCLLAVGYSNIALLLLYLMLLLCWVADYCLFLKISHCNWGYAVDWSTQRLHWERTCETSSSKHKQTEPILAVSIIVKLSPLLQIHNFHFRKGKSKLFIASLEWRWQIQYFILWLVHDCLWWAYPFQSSYFVIVV